MAREEITYNFMKCNFKNRTFITPDIVLTNKHDEFDKKKNNCENRVLFCFRNDVEKALDADTIASIEKLIKSKGYIIKKFDTETNKVISDKEREKVLNETMRIFSDSDYVITDRLHGMIFSVINGIPCLAFDNTTRKVSGVASKWLSNDNVIIYNSKHTLIEQINLLFEMKRFVYNPQKALSVFDAVFEEINGE